MPRRWLGIGLALIASGGAVHAATTLPCGDHLQLSLPDGRRVCLDRTPIGRQVPLQYFAPLHRLVPDTGYMSVASAVPAGSCPDLVSFVRPADGANQTPGSVPPYSPLAVKNRSDRALDICESGLRRLGAPADCKCTVLIENGAVLATEDAGTAERLADGSERSPRGPDSPPPRRTADGEPARPGSGRVVSTGSGFTVTERHVVTNHHVVEKCGSVEVHRGDLGGLATIAAVAPTQDLALLRTEFPVGTPVTIRSSAALGEDVMAAGHPLAGMLSNDLIVSMGQINSLGGLRNDPNSFQFSAPVQHGSSGGPLLDRSGSLVGVVRSKLNAMRVSSVTGDIPQNINFGIKPEVLRLFLDTNRVSYQRAVAAKPQENVALAEQARASTVQVVCRD